MDAHKIADILFNLSLDMDYADYLDEYDIEIRKLLEINLYRWKKLMTDTKVLVEKYLDEYYND